MADNETVYTRMRRDNGGGGKPVLHTDEDCYMLQRVQAYRETTRSEIYTDWRICKICDGTRERGGVAKGVDTSETANKLSDLSPDDVPALSDGGSA